MIGCPHADILTSTAPTSPAATSTATTASPAATLRTATSPGDTSTAATSPAGTSTAATSPPGTRGTILILDSSQSQSQPLSAPGSDRAISPSHASPPLRRSMTGSPFEAALQRAGSDRSDGSLRVQSVDPGQWRAQLSRRDREDWDRQTVAMQVEQAGVDSAEGAAARWRKQLSHVSPQPQTDSGAARQGKSPQQVSPEGPTPLKEMGVSARIREFERLRALKEQVRTRKQYQTWKKILISTESIVAGSGPKACQGCGKLEKTQAQDLRRTVWQQGTVFRSNSIPG